MSWKLVLLLSILGLVMAFAARLAFVPDSSIGAKLVGDSLSGDEIQLLGLLTFWLVTSLITSYLIATRCAGRHFRHGLLLGPVFFFWSFVAFPAQIELIGQIGLMTGGWNVYGVPLVLPLLFLGSGIVLGLLALAAAKLSERRATP